MKPFIIQIYTWARLVIMCMVVTAGVALCWKGMKAVWNFIV